MAWLLVPTNAFLAMALGAQFGLLASVLDNALWAILLGAGFGLLSFGLAWTVFGGRVRWFVYVINS